MFVPHPVRWFHDWEDRILVENWIPIRYQPIVFTFLFVGIVFVVFNRPTLPSMTAMAGPIAAYVWLTLAVACPPLLFVAWLMVRLGTGRKTYFGYWARFGADIGQLFSFMAFLLAIASDPSPEPEDAYAQILLASIWVFLLIIVVRDVLKLVLLERTSTAVHMVHEQDAAILEARDAQDIADVREGIESTRQKVERDRLRIGDLSDDATVSKARADEAQARESQRSLHKDDDGA